MREITNARGIVISGNKIALIHRWRNSEEYYATPGGFLIKEETVKEGLKREVFEETGLRVKKNRYFMTSSNGGKFYDYFICEVEEVLENLKLNGDELNYVDAKNRWVPEWVEMEKLGEIDMRPEELKEKLIIKNAAEVIKKGGLVLFPSDTVYILAVDPTNQAAVDKLLAFKNRWVGKAISIAVKDKKMAEEFVNLSENANSIYDNLLPGPFTIVSDGKHKTAKGIEAENGTLGIRIPDNKKIAELVENLGGPVTATSANLSGRTPNYSVASFLRPLSKKKLAMIDLIVDGGKLPKNKPSTVIDATNPEIKILRRGDLITGSSETLISKSEKETEKIAEFIFKKIQNKKPLVFGLSGDLGCGKTVFSRRVGHLLGVRDKITSPTFVIYNEYKIETRNGKLETGIKKFLHFDLYRLSGKYEFEEIDFLNQFSEGTVSCIEWPENMGEEYLEKLKAKTNYIPINFRYIDATTREIKIPK